MTTVRLAVSVRGMVPDWPVFAVHSMSHVVVARIVYVPCLLYE
jgi:hypothetical protein